MQSLHAYKRKQESSNFAAANEPFGTSELNSKKQRLSYEQHPMNGEQTQYNNDNHVANGYIHDQMNGHSQTSNNHLETPVTVHLQEDEMASDVGRVPEPMECAEEQRESKTEVNGNLVPTSNGKYCPHGHLNMCTTYNVPCRYPRMYCHPGGLLEDRLSIYHGI
ncbi:uncharacterized protein LOC114531098 [Dendronephthya gigantea]|uniref:uncharacterized protein LOC114531098 n=1 Tax=Dendronephthya gigantea TaxID=151771 RepID=UPI00106D6A0B|nr:uncharacterized protein LOC114531098 [Dendronephthya gigantea]